MKKIIFALSVCVSMSFAQLVDGVAVLVNNLPITLVDIVGTARAQKVDNEQALQLLITKKIQEWSLTQKKISVSDYEVNKQIEKIAGRNNMTVEQLKSALKAQYISYDVYKEDVKKELEKQKLFEQIAQDNFTPFDDKSLQDYYESHKKDFAEPLKLDVIQYVSKNQKDLEGVIVSPLAAIPNSVQKQELAINTASLDVQIVNMFKNAKVGAFTPILPIKNEFVTFYVKDISEWHTLPFADVRNQVFEAMAMQRQEESIKEYFEKLKASANIQIIRLP